MNNSENTPTVISREPWNKGKLIGQKPPLRPKHVWEKYTRSSVMYITNAMLKAATRSDL